MATWLALAAFVALIGLPIYLMWGMPRAHRPARMETGEEVVVPDNNTRVDGEKVPFHFDQSLGVRKDDGRLRDELNAAIEKSKPEIQAVLKEEGIPLQQASNPSGSKS